MTPIHLISTSQPEEIAHEANLTYVNDKKPGIKRVRTGKNFYYLDIDNKKITNDKLIDRISKLVIPPAWEKVWISPLSSGHIQAIGFDEKGRKQYIYHPKWILYTQQHKFDKLCFFVDVLPAIRTKVNKDMNQKNLSKERILATIVWLLGHTYIRVGNKEYAKDNNSYGLTTLRTKHIELHSNEVTFSFVGKSGIAHEVEVTNPKIVKTIRKLEELPGYELFQYIGAAGEKYTVNSDMVNDYLKEIAGNTISAKDFRTWGGTLLCAVTLKELGSYITKKEARKNITQAVKTVAAHLRNTPSISRHYYIHPTIIKSYEDNILIPYFEKMEKNAENKPSELSKNEFAVAELLKNCK